MKMNRDIRYATEAHLVLEVGIVFWSGLLCVAVMGRASCGKRRADARGGSGAGGRASGDGGRGGPGGGSAAGRRHRNARDPLMADRIPHDSLADLLAAVRPRAAPAVATGIPALAPLAAPDVLLIDGPPAAAKSRLLFHLLINAILHPAAFHAVLLDTDLSYDGLHFSALLRARLGRLLPDADELILHSRAQSALQRLHIFRPGSSAQLAATLYHLPKYLADHAPNQRLGFVGIDSVGAFYWPDRYTAQEMHSADQHYVHPLHHVFDALQSLHLHYGPVIVLTNWGLIPDTSMKSHVTIFRQHLNIPSDSIEITRHITLAPATESQTVHGQHSCQVTAVVRHPESFDKEAVFSFEIQGDDLVVP